MIGIALELVSRCGHCNEALPLNALVSHVVCGRCQRTTTFSVDDWVSLLEDALHEAPTSDVGHGSSSSIFSRHNYQMLWARFDPYFFDTKDDMDLAGLPEAAERGFVPHPGAGAAETVRRLPEPFADALPGVLFAVAEDPRQLPAEAVPSGFDVVTATEPQSFTCPQCGGGLQVDGRQRAVPCEYCHTSSVLPDEVWIRLHPVTTKKRWFLVYDEHLAPYRWEDDLWDAVADGEGRVYLAVECDDDDSLHVVCLGPDRRLQWRRADLNYAADTYDREARLALTGDGRLVVWQGERHSLVVLSCEDGSQLDKLGGKGGRQPQDGSGKFSLKGSYSLATAGDGTLLVWHPSPDADGDGYDLWELKRFDPDGNRIDTWLVPTPETEKPPTREGFFSRLGRLFGNAASTVSEVMRTPYLEDLRDRPGACRTERVWVTVGPDGSIFLAENDRLARYTADGKQHYSLQLPCRDIEDGACGRADGSALVLCDLQDVEGHIVLAVSADGKDVRVELASAATGGKAGEEETLTVAPDGTVHLLGYSDRWRIVAPDGSVRYRSKASAEFEAELESAAEDDED
jgi:hypothetical protein